MIYTAMVSRGFGRSVRTRTLRNLAADDYQRLIADGWNVHCFWYDWPIGGKTK